MDFKTTNYYEFIKNYNIFNADLASEDNLNAGPNQLKRELNNIWSLLRILQDKPVFKWQPNIKYEPGEIVYYTENDNPTLDEIRRSYYQATTEENNYAKVPATNPLHWGKIGKISIFPDFDGGSYVKFTDNPAWNPNKEYDPVHLKFFNEALNDTLTNTLQNFIPFNNTKPYEITHDYNAVNKKYMDSELDKIKKGSVEDAKKLIGFPGEDFVRVTNNNKLIAKGSDHNFIRSTTQGFLPGTINSVVGSRTDAFKEMHAKEFFGIATSARYADLAEYYEADDYYEPGTVLAVGGSKEVTKYMRDMPLAGVVSENPGFILNSESKECKTMIALKGRVKVKVKNFTKKGMYVYAGDEGFAFSDTSYLAVFSHLLIGIAISDSDQAQKVLVKI